MLARTMLSRNKNTALEGGRWWWVVGVMSLPSCVTSLVRVTGDSGDPALEQD